MKHNFKPGDRVQHVWHKWAGTVQSIDDHFVAVVIDSNLPHFPLYRADAADLDFAKPSARDTDPPSAPEGMKFDDHKPRPTLMPPKAEAEVVDVLTYGAKKYSPENWRKVPNATERYLDAALRHISAFRRGENHDEESDLHPLAHAIAGLMFVLELELESD